MEHPGTFRNIPEHRIIMRKICKIKCSVIKLYKNLLVSARIIRLKKKQTNKQRQQIEKKKKIGQKNENDGNE